MEYLNTLICVENLEKSKEFYNRILGLGVIADFGANITLTGGIALQTKESWKEFIHKDEKDIITQNHAMELYFEEGDIDQFYKKIVESDDIELVHEMKEHSWGQRVVRFYDPDKHIIEVGESLSEVVKRFQSSGLSTEEIAVRMDIPELYVKNLLAQ